MNEAIRLLHVDDNPEFTGLTADFLDREFDAVDIVQAADAEEGLKCVQSESIDCVISDYKLPGMDGIDLLEEVREKYPDVPFILFTGKGSEAVASEAISAGATDYFRKGRIENQYDLLANRIQNAISATRAKQRVESRTREYRTLVEEAPVAVLVITETLEIRYVNEQAVETLGAPSRNDLVGEKIGEFVHPTDERAAKRFDTVFTDQTSVDPRVYEFQDVDGNTRYARGTVVPMTFEGEPAAQVVASDITERKHQERRVQRRHEQITQLHDIGVEIAGCETQKEVYSLMVEAAERILDLDLCIVDSYEGGNLIVEATSAELTEYKEGPIEESGLAGKSYLTGESYLVHDTNEHPESEPVGKYQSTVTVPLGDFGVFQAAAYDAGAFDERDLELVEILAGHVTEALVRLEQQDQLREQRDQLKRENERLDQFASIVSHDIRNPLNVAQLRLDLAMDECNSDHLEAVARSVDRMETLTDELLALARIGDETTDPVSLDLASVTDRCWHNVETGDARLSVSTDCRIRADETRLQQLLENLLRNAIEHGGEHVTVTVGRLGEADGFYVEDDGSGMSEEIRDQAFDSGFSTRDDGTGFGLAIVSRVVNVHDWDVRVTESDSGGARFEFTGVDVE